MEAESAAETRLNAAPVLWRRRRLFASSVLEVKRMAGLRELTNAGERRRSRLALRNGRERRNPLSRRLRVHPPFTLPTMPVLITLEDTNSLALIDDHRPCFTSSKRQHALESARLARRAGGG